MSSLAPHPGRSVEFLSRLIDGELTAAERAQFESHRAHCAECRRAASEFESALTLFRSSRPRPAAADLSARILRKLQAGNRRRSSFGVTFGIDLRWAGAFAAALLAVLIGSTVVVRREAAERRLARENAPISVSMEPDRPADKNAKDQLQASAPVPAAPQQRSAVAPAPAREGALDRGEAVNAYANSDTVASSSVDGKLTASNAPAKERLQDKQEKEVLRRDSDSRMNETKPSEPKFEAQSRSRQEFSPKPPAAAAAPARVAPAPAAAAGRGAEKAGGEGGVSLDGVSDSSAARPSLKILAADEWGSVPLVVNARDFDLPADLRGREFLLLVEASGRVRDVRATEKRSLKKKAAARDEERAQDPALEEKTDKGPETLRSLRFAPGDRPRRLLVRVE